MAMGVSAAEQELFTLKDGRRLIGIYDAEAGTVTAEGGAVVIRVRPGDIASRQPAPAAAPVPSTDRKVDIAPPVQDAAVRKPDAPRTPAGVERNGLGRLHVAEVALLRAQRRYDELRAEISASEPSPAVIEAGTQRDAAQKAYAAALEDCREAVFPGSRELFPRSRAAAENAPEAGEVWRRLIERARALRPAIAQAPGGAAAHEREWARRAESYNQLVRQIADETAGDERRAATWLRKVLTDPERMALIAEFAE
jgi:hypothetical protein